MACVLACAPLRPADAAGGAIGCCEMVKPGGQLEIKDITEDECLKPDTAYEKKDWSGTKRSNTKKTKCEEKPTVAPRELGEPVIFTPAVTVPGSNYVAGQGVKLEESTLPLANYIIAIFKYSIGAIGILAVIVMMIGGIMWLMSAGNSEQIKQAKNWMGGSLVGLLIAFGSFLILSTVNSSLVNLKITPIPRIDKVDANMGCCKKILHDNQITAQNPKVTTVNLPQSVCERLKETQINSNGYEAIEFVQNYEALNNECVDSLGCCSIGTAGLGGAIAKKTKTTTRFNCKSEPGSIASFNVGMRATEDGNNCIVEAHESTSSGKTCIAQDADGCVQKSDCCSPLQCATGYAAGNPGGNDTKCVQCIPQWKWGCQTSADCCAGLTCTPHPEGKKCE